MANANQIRITRTTGLFVTALGRILREHLKLDVCDHECWTFIPTREREQCGSPGDCPWHDPVYLGSSRYGMHCYPYQIRTYLATGHVNIRVCGRVELRAVIEHTTNDAFGVLYQVRLWARDKDGKTHMGTFGIQDDGSPYVEEGLHMKSEPPHKIAFWQKSPELPEELLPA